MKTMHQLSKQADNIRNTYLTISDRYSVSSQEENILNKRYTNAMMAVSDRIIKHQYV